MYDPGRALQDTWYHRAHGCSRKGIRGCRMSRVLQEGCCGGWGGTGSLHPPRKGVMWDKASQDPFSPWEGGPGGQDAGRSLRILGRFPWGLSLLGSSGTDAHGGLSFQWLRWLCSPHQLDGAVGVTWFVAVLLQEGPPIRGTKHQPCVGSSIKPCVWGDLLFFLLPPEEFKTIIMFSSLCQAEKCMQSWLGCCEPLGASLPLTGSQDPRNSVGLLPEASGLERSLPRPPTEGTAGEVAEGALGLGRQHSLVPGEWD